MIQALTSQLEQIELTGLKTLRSHELDAVTNLSL